MSMELRLEDLSYTELEQKGSYDMASLLGERRATLQYLRFSYITCTCTWFMLGRICKGIFKR